MNRLLLFGMLLFGMLSGMPLAAFADAGTRDDPAERVTLHVGQEQGDLRGQDHRVIQAAIDHVANLGGGTVHVGPGKYRLRCSITLRSGVRLVGTPGKTILVPVDGVKAPLTVDGDANQREVTLADPSGFQIGDRVLVADDTNASAFRVTSAVLTARSGKATFRISEPLRDDYMVRRKARVEHSFPAVGGWGVRDAFVEGFLIEGNRGRTACSAMDGCRHGGIYLFECEKVTVRRCTVQGFNGDGISFQVSSGVVVEDCLCENNAGHGMHPGSGSQRPTLRRNRLLGNGGDGLFVCWRVQHGLFESTEIHGNRGVGISIGHKDTDNRFRTNCVTGNMGVGLFFRNESESMGAHRNLFEKNIFLDNGLAGAGKLPAACVVIRGLHHDLTFRDNRIGFSNALATSPPAFLTEKGLQRLNLRDNRYPHVSQELETKDPR
jgi:parallel beta-helix repeat protein